MPAMARSGLPCSLPIGTSTTTYSFPDEAVIVYVWPKSRKAFAEILLLFSERVCGHCKRGAQPRAWLNFATAGTSRIRRLPLRQPKG